MDIIIPIEDLNRRSALYGTTDRNLRLIRSAFDVRISARDGKVHISGQADAVEKAARVVDDMQRNLRHRPDLTEELVLELIAEGQYSTPKLAEKLNVSIPTVSRYVTALRERGHAISAEKQAGSWRFVLVPQKSTDEFNLHRESTPRCGALTP